LAAHAASHTRERLCFFLLLLLAFSVATFSLAAGRAHTEQHTNNTHNSIWYSRRWLTIYRRVGAAIVDIDKADAEAAKEEHRRTYESV
jgi:hypothetical protein